MISSYKLNKSIAPEALAASTALFLNAGDLKSDPRLSWIPIDLTLLSASFILILVAKSLISGANRDSGHHILWTLGFTALFIPGILLSPQNLYAVEKIRYLLTLTPLAFLAGIVIGYGKDGFLNWIGWMLVFGLLIAGDGMLRVLASSGGLDRVTGFGGNTISLGRAAGLAFLVLGLKFLFGPWTWIKQGLWMTLTLAVAVVILFSGSRGPLIAALLALPVALIIARRCDAIPRFTLLAGFLFAAIASVWTFIPAGSLARIATFASGQFGSSELTRKVALAKAIPLIIAHPLGIGWGGFVGQISSMGGSPRQYVHNVIMESFMEGGWLTGIGVLSLIIASRARMARHASPANYAIWASLFVYTLFNALVSGDLNDNRVFFVILGLGLGSCAGMNGTITTGQ